MLKMNKTRATRPCVKNGVSSSTRNNDEVDRIGSLPDEVLTHILSFLSTKDAVQTCILSKRWKNTWAAVPILDIKLEDFSEFGDGYFSGDDDDDWCRDNNEELRIHMHRFQGFRIQKMMASTENSGGDNNEEWRIALARSEEWRMSLARFERFMTGFFDNRAPTNLERVRCMRHFYRFQPDTSFGWLDHVALLMPQLVFISIVGDTNNSLDIPDKVFSCTSLHHLSMTLHTGDNKTIIRPVSINLPNLKILELTWVELNRDFGQQLFMGCPTLEKLKLCYCDLYFSGISSEVLKELTLQNCYLYEPIQISCPNVVSLIMRIYLLRGGISLKNMSSLVNAVIKLYRDGNDVPVLNLLGSLSNAAKLELYLDPRVLKEQLEKDIRNCRNFNNLKNLVVGGWDISNDFYLIACLLKHSPNLKELGLLLDEIRGQIQEPRREVSVDTLFQYEYLETIKIGSVSGHTYLQRILSREVIDAMIKTLGTYVKKIGNVIIT